MNSMNAPKILPWIASKAGISEALALKLWRRAVSEAEYLTGNSESAEFWGLAIERFLENIEDETGISPQYTLTPAPRMTWLLHHQNRMSMLGLTAAQNAYRFWQNTWDSLYAQQKAA